jgi:hypothetical protein
LKVMLVPMRSSATFLAGWRPSCPHWGQEAIGSRHCLRQTRSVCAREPLRRSNPRLLLVTHGLLRGACHRTRIRATRWLAMTQATKKPPKGLFPNSLFVAAQWASAQTFFLVKYNRTVSRIRNTNTCMPSRLRASMWGSAVHIRNVVTSLAYCATVAGEPSS